MGCFLTTRIYEERPVSTLVTVGDLIAEVAADEAGRVEAAAARDAAVRHLADVEAKEAADKGSLGLAVHNNGGGVFVVNADGTATVFESTGQGPDGTWGYQSRTFPPASAPVDPFPPPQPLPFTVTFTRSATMSLYDGVISLPSLSTDPAELAEVASQTLTVTVNGTALPDFTPALTDTVVTIPAAFSVNDQVGLKLQYFNPSNLPGPERDETAVVTDTHVPPQPGEFGIAFTPTPA